MSYKVEVILDSLAPSGARLTTFKLMYPKFIHSEFMTHRMISRNASSSRAIPTAKMIEWIKSDPVMPVYWGRNKSGMQATEELSELQIEGAKRGWLWARDKALDHAKTMMDMAVHKQIASRILEPWAHINVVASATDWSNFFALRCHKDAQPEMVHLAVKMARAYRDSVPKKLKYGDRHLPFINEFDREHLGAVDLIKVSVARCARVSYLTHEGRASTTDDDFALHDRLLESGHWSPFEHQAMVSGDHGLRSGNFSGGWIQFRQVLPKSVHTEFDFAKLDEFKEIP